MLLNWNWPVLNPTLQIGQVKSVFPSWTFILWSFLDCFVVNLRRQSEHSHFFFPSWTDSKCRIKFWFRAKLKSHFEHTKDLIPSWTLALCLAKSDCLKKASSHWPHWWGLILSWTLKLAWWRLKNKVYMIVDKAQMSINPWPQIWVDEHHIVYLQQHIGILWAYIGRIPQKCCYSLD